MIHVAVAPERTADQVAFPLASEVSTLHAAAQVGIRIPSNSPVPVTSSEYAGVVFQIPMNTPDWKSRDAKIPTHPAQKTERYPLDHHVIPVAVDPEA